MDRTDSNTQSFGRAMGQFQTGRNRTSFKYSINLGIEEEEGGVDALMWDYGYRHKIWGWDGYRYGKVLKTVAHILMRARSLPELSHVRGEDIVHGEDPYFLVVKWKINCHMEYDWWKYKRNEGDR